MLHRRGRDAVSYTHLDVYKRQALIGAFDRLSDSIAGMRQSVSQMRMQRIDKLFAPLPRIVRDLAQELGKNCLLYTSRCV